MRAKRVYIQVPEIFLYRVHERFKSLKYAAEMIAEFTKRLVVADE